MSRAIEKSRLNLLQLPLAVVSFFGMVASGVADFSQTDSAVLGQIRSNTEYIEQDVDAIRTHTSEIDYQIRNTLGGLLQKIYNNSINEREEDIITIYGMLSGSPSPFTHYTNGVVGLLESINETGNLLYPTVSGISNYVELVRDDLLDIKDDVNIISEYVQGFNPITDGLYEGSGGTNTVGRKPFLEEIAQSSSNQVAKTTNQTEIISGGFTAVTNAVANQTTNTISILEQIRQGMLEQTNGVNPWAEMPKAVTNLISFVFSGSPGYNETVHDWLNRINNSDPETSRGDYLWQDIIAHLGYGYDTFGAIWNPEVQKVFNNTFGYEMNESLEDEVGNLTSSSYWLSETQQEVSDRRYAAYGTAGIRSTLESYTNRVDKFIIPLLQYIATNPTPVTVNFGGGQGPLSVKLDTGEDISAPTVDEPDPNDFEEKVIVNIPNNQYDSAIGNVVDDPMNWKDALTAFNPAIEEMQDQLAREVGYIMTDSEAGSLKLKVTKPHFDQLPEDAQIPELELDFTIPEDAQNKIDKFWKIIIGATKLTINVVLFFRLFSMVFQIAESSSSNAFEDI